MRKSANISTRGVEKTVTDILKSRVNSRIYIYLLKKGGAKADQVVKGTKLYPSTVREALADMYRKRLIYRKKLKSNSIGKNPYVYYPIPPIELLKRYSNEIEEKLNKLASLAVKKGCIKDYKPFRIGIYEEGTDRV